MTFKVTEGHSERLSTLWVLIVVLFFLHASVASVLQRKYQEAVILESSNQGIGGMYAVACVFRNRLNVGLPIGSAGIKRDNYKAFIKRQPRHIRFIATCVTLGVFTYGLPDITFGATHFESTDFKKPKWARHMLYVCRYGKHVFYKEVIC